jgi:calcineurin-like phosphoesterase family protein
MAYYYISDLHLGHANVIRFDNRPFADVDEMNRILIERWNTAVSTADTVYILGDFCWLREPFWPAFLEQLSGQKVLIRGNHDPRQFSSEVKKFFQDIREYMELVDNGKRVILCHYPIPFHKAAYNPDCWMLYGHVHVTREQLFMEQLRREIQESREKQGDCVGNWVNVGCMMPWMDYTPRTLDEIICLEAQFRSSET